MCCGEWPGRELNPPTRGFSERRMLIHPESRRATSSSRATILRCPFHSFRSIQTLGNPQSSGTTQVLAVPFTKDHQFLVPVHLHLGARRSDPAAMPQVPREIYGGNAALPELALEHIPIRPAQGCARTANDHATLPGGARAGLPSAAVYQPLKPRVAPERGESGVDLQPAGG